MVHFTQSDLTVPQPLPSSPQLANRESLELAYVALQAISQAIVTIDRQGYIQSCNTTAQTWLTKAANLPPETDLTGMAMVPILPILDEATRDPIGISILIDRLQHLHSSFELFDQLICLTATGEVMAIDLTVAPIADATGLNGAVLVLQDVTIARQTTRTLSWQAHHDGLTGLVNRAAFEVKLAQAIQHAQHSRQPHTLCYIDLDQFKIVNDTCGHNAGDQLLRRLAQIFQREIRSTDTLSRIGGDEFGILFHDCSLHQAHPIVERIHQQMAQFRFLWQEQSFNISASFGLVQIDRESVGLTAVLSAADAACYAAKEAGRNRIHLYYSDDNELARQRGERLWISQIHQAIEENRFQLYAQDIVPIVPDGLSPTGGHHACVEPLQEGQLKFERHVEILLRMIDRDGKIIAPGCFIPAAERYGLMTELDRVVIETFFRAYANACLSNSGRPLDSCLYAINLSARSLNDAQFINFVKAKFAEYRLPPHVICFEITETAAISNIEQAIQFIEELKQMGCHFALDDFGSGMNCFAYLKQLKIDYLKIDGSFIQNITTEKIDQELVSCMNRIAHVLGVKTVAEWVENDEILQTLRELDIDYAQGYGLHRPEPLEFTLMG